MKNRHRRKAKAKLKKIRQSSYEAYKLVPLDSCDECGEMDLDKLTRHHIMPKSKGGSDLEENIQVLCRKCHNKEHE